MEEEDLQAVRAHNHLVEEREELVHYIREKERQESQVCACCEREREQREWVRVNRVYERLAARWNATYKGIRIKRTSYVVYEFIRSTSRGVFEHA